VVTARPDEVRRTRPDKTTLPAEVPSMPGQLVQILGSLLILVPFGLAQLGRMSPRSRPYLIVNLTGSAALAADAAIGSQWGFLLLEGAWAVVSLAGLVRLTAQRWSLGRRGRPARQPVDEDVDEHLEAFVAVGERELAGEADHVRELPGRQ
jgi:hypothetical protein